MNDNKKTCLVSFLVVLMGIPRMAFSQGEIPVDGSLKNNAESWKVKTIQRAFIRYRPAEISFGPVYTVNTDAEKVRRLSRETSRDLFWKDIKTVSSRESSIELAYQETDTAIVNMLTVTTDKIHKRNATGVIFHADKTEDETIASQTWVDEMIIHFQKDTSEWRYTKTDSATRVSSGYTGKLYSSNDSFFVKPIDNLAGKKFKDMVFSVPATGIIFWHDGKQVAAMQLTMKRMVWISKEMMAPAKEAILVTMTAIFATIEDENGMGF